MGSSYLPHPFPRTRMRSLPTDCPCPLPLHTHPRQPPRAHWWQKVGTSGRYVISISTESTFLLSGPSQVWVGDRVPTCPWIICRGCASPQRTPPRYSSLPPPAAPRSWAPLGPPPLKPPGQRIPGPPAGGGQAAENRGRSVGRVTIVPLGNAGYVF